MAILRFPSLRNFPWTAILLSSLGFWLSTSAVLDLLILPTLAQGGMMRDRGFASVGLVLFSSFNHGELVLGALVFTALLMLHYNHPQPAPLDRPWLIAGGLLFAIPFLYAYLLTPQMSGWAWWITSHEATTMPTAMLLLHGLYWLLEVVKIALCVWLCRGWYQRICNTVSLL